MTYKYFKLEDFACSDTGENEIQDEFVKKLDELRESCGFPFIVTSGYRSPNHPIEAKKSSPGTHAQGIAADIRITTAAERHCIVKEAMKLGFTGIGVDKTFVHVDTRGTPAVMWLY